MSFHTRLFFHRPFFSHFTVNPRLNVSPSNMSRRGVGRTAVHAGDLKKSTSHKRRRNSEARTMRERERGGGLEEIGKVNGEHLARHLFLMRRACHAISRSLLLARGPLCSFHSMDGVGRRGVERKRERWIEIRRVGRWNNGRRTVARIQYFTSVFPHFNSARLGKKFKPKCFSV